ncbi:MAG TPA: hypothetical protein VFH38_03555 [Jatrophihabitans sp.]|nr:hypothetical protein [Jatrophihabitans sp.]
MTAGVIGVRGGSGLAALRSAVRRLRRSSPAAPAPAPSPQHPLRVSDVMQRAGLASLPAADDGYRTACPVCADVQSLAQASVEPASTGITAYRCRNGCTQLAVTGYPQSVPDCAGWQVAVGEFVITSLVPAGLQFTSGKPEA